ncbi:MAG: tetratricopeptide repeat protein [Calothrix sp. MO_192.B10]|nr:tetratricopeptide repeat protein [Calothrix sp. MO_192.B10]
MNRRQLIEDIPAYNENSWQELCWAIEQSSSTANSTGEFSLILAHCNSANLRRRLTEKLQSSCPVEIREILLDQSVTKLYRNIRAELGDEHPQGLVISGLESLQEIDSVLKSANQVREEFRKHFPFPVVLWMTDAVLQKLIKLAHDLYSWATIVEFAIDTDDLIQVIQQTADRVFTKVLDVGAGRFLHNTTLNLGIGSPQRIELESARLELQYRGVTLQPELEAGLEFVLGRDTGNLEQSWRHYERSLALLQQAEEERSRGDKGEFAVSSSRLPTADCRLPTPQLLEKQGCLLYSMGLWWRTYAVLHRMEEQQACEHARDYFRQCISVFEQANRSDLVANFINALGSVLKHLEEWDELEPIAHQALELHQAYPHEFRLARAYSLLAVLDLAKSAPTEAKEKAQQALKILDNAVSAAKNSSSAQIIADLDWEQSYHRGWYLFTLGEAQLALGETEAAINTLETAKKQTKHQYDPELYISILSKLHKCDFEQGEYLKAFEIKQQQRSLEQQYGFHAFIGAGRLQPKQQVSNPALPLVKQQGTIAAEIAAAGREQDIKRLIKRMGEAFYKLTIIHGQSGVGKSSILQAGLIPVLQHKTIDARDVVPVLQQVYTNWVKELGNCLRDAMSDLNTRIYGGRVKTNFPLLEGDVGEESILKQLQTSSDNGLLTVLIFDQFEEFFFVYKDSQQRLPFYRFLRECLDVANVRVILSLREDYLYYLLECNQRLIDFDVINNNILDKDILYYIGNFSPEDTKLLIHNLTETTQLDLKPELIDDLVADLARDLGEVRPIELQVVGTQLQTEEISTLEKYKERGPKEKLVGRFLEEVVKDCGENNEKIAKSVLYLLTDENNIRPLKTRADLESELKEELDIEVVSEKLDLVLLILVRSGLVFKLPSVPDDHYQLVHDYLVPFVRTKAWENEKEQRKLTEEKLNDALKEQLIAKEKLNDALKQQLLEAQCGLLWKVSLGTIAGALSMFLPFVLIHYNNAHLISMSAEAKSLLKSDKNLKSLVKSLKAGKRLQQWSSIGVKLDTKMKVLGALQDVVYTIKERNTLEGHNDTVTSVNFSPNGEMVVSGDASGMLIIWKKNGKEIKSIEAHDNKIISLSFSPDNQTVLSASEEDKTLKLWNLKGEKIVQFKGHEEGITSFSFSPSGQKIASGSKDGNIKLWNVKNGKEIPTFKSKKHGGSIKSISFSPDGKTIVSVSDEGTGKFWDLKGKELKTWNGVRSKVIFRPDGKTINQQRNQQRNNTFLKRADGSLLKILYLSHSLAFNGRDIDDSQTISTVSLSSENINAINAELLQDDGQTIGTVSLSTENPNAINAELLQIDTGEKTSFLLEGHKKEVTSASLSPNGKMLASGSKDKTVKLWSLEKKNFTTPDGSRAAKVSFNPKGDKLASVKRGQVQLFQRQGNLTTKLPGYHSEVSFNHDNQIVTGTQESTVQIWRSDGTFVKSLGGTKALDDYINWNFSPDGRTIALVKNDNSVKLFSSDDGKAIATLKGHKDRVYSITFSPDGEIITTASKDKTIKLWRKDGTPITTLKDYKGGVKKIGFSPNGKNLAILEGNNTVNFLRRDGTKIRTLKSDEEMSVYFSPDGEIVAIDNRVKDKDKEKVELWRIDGTLIKKLEPQGNSNSITFKGFTPDSQAIVTNSDEKVQVWNRYGGLITSLKDVVNPLLSPNFQTWATVEDNKVKLGKLDGNPIRTIKLKTERANIKKRDIKFSPDGQTLVVKVDQETVEIWGTDGTLLNTLQGFSDNNIGQDDYFELNDHLSFSSDSKTIAIRTNENEVQLWGINTNGNTKVSRLNTITGKDDWIRGLKSIPNSDKIAIIGGNHTVKLWQLPLEPGKKAQLLETLRDHKNFVNSVSISPNGEMIASASDDNTVKVWQLNGKLIKLIKNFTEHKDKVNSVIFSPDSKLIASASDDKTVKVWKPDGGVIKSFEDHNNGITSVSFSRNGKMIVSGSKDKIIKLWSWESTDSKPLKNFDNEEDVTSVSFSPDGKMIASADSRKVKLWSIDENTLPTTYEKFGNRDVSFSPDRKTMTIAAGGEKYISVWKFDLDELLKRGCEKAKDYLKHNPKVKQSDRTLCDDILKQK